MNNSTPFPAGAPFDQLIELPSPCCGDEIVSQASHVDIKEATHSGFNCTSYGRQTSYKMFSPGCDNEYPSQAAANTGFDYTSVGRQDQTQLQITNQQETVDFLSSKLSQCHGGLGPGDGLLCDLALGTVESQTKYNEKRKAAMWKSSKGQFPTKLYAMLELADVQGYGSSSNAVAWLPHGRAFRVLDEKIFVESIVPVFFKQTKIRSFYRQLNLWGFKRLSMGCDAGAWYNEFFVRGSQSEIKKMVRIKVKGKSNVNHREPGFYSTAATLPGSTKPAIELPNGDGEFVEESSSSNKYANETELSQPKYEVIGASNNMPMQYGYAQSTATSGNELNLSNMPCQVVTPAHFPCNDVQSNSTEATEPLPFNDDVRCDDTLTLCGSEYVSECFEKRSKRMYNFLKYGVMEK
ncbi:hypothetical protein ACHAXR_010478 [Thalassiosira sp. AJA248-18]